MNKFLREHATCCICRVRAAKKTIQRQADFLGHKIPIMAVLCNRCNKLDDRDEVLDAYVQRIFGSQTIQ